MGERQHLNSKWLSVFSSNDSFFHCLLKAPNPAQLQEVQFLRGGFLIFSISTGNDSTTPRVQVEPVEGTKSREMKILGAGIGCIPDQGIHEGDKGLIGRKLRLQLHQYSS